MLRSAISGRRRVRAVAVFLLAAGLHASGTAHAEKADRDKPVNIEADRMNADDARKTAVFEGRVLLTQGTLTIKADRIMVRQDRDGFQYGTATGAPATFRQKRDGSNEYVDAEAVRIQYDARADKVEFFEQARLRRDSGDDVRGNYISYDARTERFTVTSRRDSAAGDAGKAGAQDRVRAVIQPRTGGSGSGETAPGAVSPGSRQ